MNLYNTMFTEITMKYIGWSSPGLPTASHTILNSGT